MELLFKIIIPGVNKCKVALAEFGDPVYVF
jgi:hypothetical protein